MLFLAATVSDDLLVALAKLTVALKAAVELESRGAIINESPPVSTVNALLLTAMEL